MTARWGGVTAASMASLIALAVALGAPRVAARTAAGDEALRPLLTETLVEMILDQDRAVHASALSALEHLAPGDDGVGEAVVERLGALGWTAAPSKTARARVGRLLIVLAHSPAWRAEHTQLAIAALDDVELREAATAALAARGVVDPAVGEAALRAFEARSIVAPQVACLRLTVHPEVSVWLDALDDPRAEVRLAAVERLGSGAGSDDAATRGLVQALGDEDPAVRGAAAGALLARGTEHPEVVAGATARVVSEYDEEAERVTRWPRDGVGALLAPGMVAALDSRVTAVRRAAFELLAAAGGLDATRIDELAGIAGGDDAEAALWAMATLTAAGAAAGRAAPAIARRLDEASGAGGAGGAAATPGSRLRAQVARRRLISSALDALVAAGADQALAERVPRLLADPDPAVRLAAARAALHLDPASEQAIKVLIDLAEGRGAPGSAAAAGADQALRVQAVETLAAPASRSAEAASALWKLVRGEATAGAAADHPDGAGAAAPAADQDDRADHGLRVAAALALDDAGRRDEIIAGLPGLTDPAVRMSMAVVVRERIAPQAGDAAPAVARVLAGWVAADPLGFSADALAALGPPADALIRGVATDEELPLEPRRQALLGIGRSGIATEARVDLLIEMIAAPGESLLLAAAAAEAIYRLGPEAARARPILLEQIRSDDLTRRRLAAFALGGAGALDVETVVALRGAVRDRDTRLRRDAARSLELLVTGGR